MADDDDKNSKLQRERSARSNMSGKSRNIVCYNIITFLFVYFQLKRIENKAVFLINVVPSMGVKLFRQQTHNAKKHQLRISGS